jgi:RNA polymerase sigma-70 factor, ECF subfamily
MKNKDDNYLMGMIAKGDSTAMKELYSRYNAHLLKYSCAILSGDKAVSEDLVQEAWIRVVRHAPKYDTSRPFKPWILRITKNICLTELSSRKRTNPSFDSEKDHSHSTFEPNKYIESLESKVLLADELLIKEVSRKRVLEALDLIPGKYRTALMAWLVEDNFVGFLSKKFGMAPSKVHQMIYTGKKKLKQVLEKEILVDVPFDVF